MVIVRLRRLRRGILVVFAALAVTSSACSSASSPSPALDFTGTTLDGAPLDAATLAGAPAVLWFWAPFCTICRAEGPGVAAIAAEYDGRVTFLGVAGRGEVEAMREFVADTGTGGFTHVVDADGSLWQRFGVVAQPAFAFVGSDGSVRTFGGSLDAEALRQATDELLGG